MLLLLLLLLLIGRPLGLLAIVRRQSTEQPMNPHGILKDHTLAIALAFSL